MSYKGSCQANNCVEDDGMMQMLQLNRLVHFIFLRFLRTCRVSDRPTQRRCSCRARLVLPGVSILLRILRHSWLVGQQSQYVSCWYKLCRPRTIIILGWCTFINVTLSWGRVVKSASCGVWLLIGSSQIPQCLWDSCIMKWKAAVVARNIWIWRQGNIRKMKNSLKMIYPTEMHYTHCFQHYNPLSAIFAPTLIRSLDNISLLCIVQNMLQLCYQCHSTVRFMFHHLLLQFLAWEHVWYKLSGNSSTRSLLRIHLWHILSP